MKHLKNINENIDNQNDKNLFLIRGDDWQGIYQNGKLLDEGHSIDLWYLLRKLGYKVESIYIESEEEWDELGNHCPEDLDEVRAKLDAKKYNL